MKALLLAPVVLFSGSVLAAIDCDTAGPQTPRNIENPVGTNEVIFDTAPAPENMYLCDVHYHRYAEHRGQSFMQPAGEGDYKGWACNGSQPSAIRLQRGEGTCGKTQPGDTIEVHWVYTSCEVDPAPGLGSCLACPDPELRVEARVFTLVDDGTGLDFASLEPTKGGVMPEAVDGTEFLGSTTGPSYNDGSCSPYQVTWNVDGGSCDKVEMSTLDAWCSDNVFNEDHAHGVRLLVKDKDLLSTIPRP